ncbi:MAG TPA: CPXCG motif-containing cysteine-rich protein, partial [Rhodanobacter sp.]
MLAPIDISCPYCGEPIEILVDASAGDQHYIEDCQVCCRPIKLS